MCDALYHILMILEPVLDVLRFLECRRLHLSPTMLILLNAIDPLSAFNSEPLHLNAAICAFSINALQLLLEIRVHDVESHVGRVLGEEGVSQFAEGKREKVKETVIWEGLDREEGLEKFLYTSCLDIGCLVAM